LAESRLVEPPWTNRDHPHDPHSQGYQYRHQTPLQPLFLKIWQLPPPDCLRECRLSHWNRSGRQSQNLPPERKFDDVTTYRISIKFFIDSNHRRKKTMRKSRWRLIWKKSWWLYHCHHNKRTTNVSHRFLRVLSYEERVISIQLPILPLDGSSSLSCQNQKRRQHLHFGVMLLGLNVLWGTSEDNTQITPAMSRFISSSMPNRPMNMELRELKQMEMELTNLQRRHSEIWTLLCTFDISTWAEFTECGSKSQKSSSWQCTINFQATS
jgi:hypothetical protein